MSVGMIGHYYVSRACVGIKSRTRLRSFGHNNSLLEAHLGLDKKMVEVAGFEPASARCPHYTSTRLVA